MMSLLYVHEVLCLALFYSVFCRCVRSSDKVRTSVRLAFVFLGLVACAGVVAPLVWGVVPDLFSLSLLAAITVVQLVTAHYWRAGVPDSFYKPGCAPRRRRQCEIHGGCPHANP